jgi:hypothetical protein
MLQYLINLSAIWLLSLLIFELFLKKETYHSYNRIYLISTFLMGILLPLWSWSSNSAIYASSVSEPLQQATAIRQTVEVKVDHSSFTDWAQYMLWVYALGVLVSIIMLMIEIIKVHTLYRNGEKSKQDNWTIIETGKGHAPFSIFGFLFVDSKAQYNAEQWNIVLAHEQQHRKLAHFADQLFMQLGQIVFWFHPFVYIYNNRLMILHEYQADIKSGSVPSVYGKFLIQQALLHPAPKLTHSLNRSPIKTRIVMLTRNSGFLARVKTIVIIPLVGLAALCFTNNVFSHERKKDGNNIYYRGNTITIERQTDTIHRTMNANEKANQVIFTREILSLLNGEKIFYEKYNPDGSSKTPGIVIKNDKIKAKVIDEVKSLLLMLEDGYYEVWVGGLIIDKNGAVAYFDIPQFQVNQFKYGKGVYVYTDPSGKAKADKLISESKYYTSAIYVPLDSNLKKAVINKISDAMDDAPKCDPILVDGKNVPYRNDVSFQFEIRKHKLVTIK